MTFRLLPRLLMRIEGNSGTVIVWDERVMVREVNATGIERKRTRSAQNYLIPSNMWAYLVGQA
jgi:hypothetical protein